MSEKKIICTIKSPMSGEIHSLDEIPDPAFARRMIGDGTAILPDDDGTIYAPADGKVVSVFETRHAIVFEEPSGIRVLLHVGIDSMRLQGKGFVAHVVSGQSVRAGAKLLTIDIAYVEQHTESMVSPVILTDLTKSQSIKVIAEGHVNVGDPIIEVYDEI